MIANFWATQIRIDDVQNVQLTMVIKILKFKKMKRSIFQEGRKKNGPGTYLCS
jgi:hypothetical protein